jgi:hypothetical protein
MNSNDREYDGLTVIKGIGPVRQQWLQETLDVRTVPELAALSADELETRLKAAGQVVSRHEIERWLTQARELARLAEPASPQVIAAAEEDHGGAVNDLANNVGKALARSLDPENSETGKKDLSSAGEDGWKPFASFVVEFQVRQLAGEAQERQTKAHYMEADKSETWPGLEGEQLCRWMLVQVTEKRRPDPKSEEPSVEVKPLITSAATVTVSQIRAFQPPQAETPVASGQAQQPVPGIIKGDEPFGLEVSFGLVGTAAVDLVKMHANYQAQFYVRSMSTGTKLHLGVTQPQPLVESKLAYTTALSQATLPPDVYRLQALVTFQDAPIGPGFLEIPMLRVV